MKIILIVLFALIPFLKTGHDPKPRVDEYEWADQRWKTEEGRQEIINEAINDLRKYLEFDISSSQNGYSFQSPTIGYRVHISTIFKGDILYPEAICRNSHVDACYTFYSESKLEKGIWISNLDYPLRVDRFEDPYFADTFEFEQSGVKRRSYTKNGITYWWYWKDEIKKNEEARHTNTGVNKISSYDKAWKYERKGKSLSYINILPKTFTRGYFLIDQKLEILDESEWYTFSDRYDEHNIKWAYAIDLKEAIQAIILHEFLHHGGYENENCVEWIVSHMILAIRETKSYYHHNIITRNELKEITSASFLDFEDDLNLCRYDREVSFPISNNFEFLKSKVQNLKSNQFSCESKSIPPQSEFISSGMKHKY